MVSAYDTPNVMSSLHDWMSCGGCWRNHVHKFHCHMFHGHTFPSTVTGFTVTGFTVLSIRGVGSCIGINYLDDGSESSN
jgi:hypothetical protein